MTKEARRNRRPRASLRAGCRAEQIATYLKRSTNITDGFSYASRFCAREAPLNSLAALFPAAQTLEQRL
jgi:hypothetical protein